MDRTRTETIDSRDRFTLVELHIAPSHTIATPKHSATALPALQFSQQPQPQCLAPPEGSAQVSSADHRFSFRRLRAMLGSRTRSRLRRKPLPPPSQSILLVNGGSSSTIKSQLPHPDALSKSQSLPVRAAANGSAAATAAAAAAAARRQGSHQNSAGHNARLARARSSSSSSSSGNGSGRPGDATLAARRSSGDAKYGSDGGDGVLLPPFSSSPPSSLGSVSANAAVLHCAPAIIDDYLFVTPVYPLQLFYATPATPAPEPQQTTTANGRAHTSAGALPISNGNSGSGDVQNGIHAKPSISDSTSELAASDANGAAAAEHTSVASSGSAAADASQRRTSLVVDTAAAPTAGTDSASLPARFSPVSAAFSLEPAPTPYTTTFGSEQYAAFWPPAQLAFGAELERLLQPQTLQRHFGSALYPRLLRAALPARTDHCIRKDLARTFPGAPLLACRAGSELLYHLLRAYAVYDYDVGYSQGLGFLAAALLLRIDDEQAHQNAANVAPGNRRAKEAGARLGPIR